MKELAVRVARGHSKAKATSNGRARARPPGPGTPSGNFPVRQVSFGSLSRVPLRTMGLQAYLLLLSAPAKRRIVSAILITTSIPGSPDRN